ncbi:MAG: hypothetical protein HY902_02295, partial [Deltaproteobacteria bacterium]|nr:hypothetical protein [Deltaproteobacteria bacterium]
MTREPYCSVSMAWAVAMVVACSAGMFAGCDQQAAPGPPTLADAGSAAAPLTLRQQAVARDPEPSDEALYDRIDALKDRFACNTVSGCPAHAALVAYGWGARPLLE